MQSSDHSRTTMRSKYVRIAAFVFLGAVLSTLLGFVVYRQHHAHCKRVEILLKDAGEYQMFSEENVSEWIAEVCGDVVGKRLDSIPLERIRQRLLSETMVKSAEVFSTIDGRCRIIVDQRIPVMRVIESSGNSYYLDDKGFPMEVRSSYFRLPLYTGDIAGAVYHKSVFESGNEVLISLFTLNEAIRGSEFWSAQTEHLAVDRNGEILLVPRVGNQRIILGQSRNYPEKLNRLKSFYNHVMKHGDINLYAAIDARFEGQIVGIKN